MGNSQSLPLTGPFGADIISISTCADVLMEEIVVASVDVVFKALGDPIRIRIVRMLARNGEMCVCMIMEDLGMTQSAVSHHLAAMKNAGLVRSRRQGQWIHYSLCRDAIAEEALAFLQETLRDLDAASVPQPCECK
jgi:DNA-binding transcriptional ArsR family regulator